MSKYAFTATTWQHVHPGDYIRVTRKGYGVREGRLAEFRHSENGGWVWSDENGKPLLDPWWAGDGAVEKMEEEDDD